MSIDRALSGQPFAVDDLRCAEAAAIVRTTIIEPETAPWHIWPEARQLEFKLLFVSICHQINWDFLQSRLYAALRELDYPVSSQLRHISAPDVERWLAGYAKPERIRARERAQMVRETATTFLRLMEEDRPGGPFHVPTNLGGKHGFYAWLQEFDAFRRDPVQKKSNVLVHELFLDKVICFVDPEHLRPAVDYHLIRLYLRTGRVYPTVREVMPFLLGAADSPRARLVQTLRSAICEAADKTAFYAKTNVAHLNRVEWQLGRATCTRTAPVCVGTQAPAVQSAFGRYADGHCPYHAMCRSYLDKSYGFFSEPDFEKTFF
jgi:hypothetical protein